MKEVEWQPEIYHQGIEARLLRRPIKENPYPGHLCWAHRSWDAGWCDTEMDQEAPLRPVISDDVSFGNTP